MNGRLIKKVVRIDEILTQDYGLKSVSNGKDPLTELVFTVLSQNTNDLNRDRAFEAMRQMFPTWEDVVNTTPVKLASAIKVGGLAKIKAARILKMLKYVNKTYNKLNLDFLKEWSVNRGRDFLLNIDGVGPTTAACVLVFSLGRDVMPVDTHVRRVSSRLGILPLKISDSAAHDYFLEFKNQVSLYQLHLNLIRHGRRICRARKPLCKECSLRRSCAYYSNNGKLRRFEV